MTGPRARTSRTGPAKAAAPAASAGPAPVRTPPPPDNLPAWLAVAADVAGSGLRPEDLLKGFDHFLAVARGMGKGAVPVERTIATALLRHLTAAALGIVTSKTRGRTGKGPRASEWESVYLSARAAVLAALASPSAPRGPDMRFQFGPTAYNLTRTAAQDHFGRSDDGWRDPNRRVSFDGSDASADGWVRDDIPDDGFADPESVASFLERTRLYVDGRSLDELQMALSRAIADLPDIDHRLIVLWSYRGHPDAEIAARFGVSAPTVKARLHALAASPHLQRYRPRSPA